MSGTNAFQSTMDLMTAHQEIKQHRTRAADRGFSMLQFSSVAKLLFLLFGTNEPTWV